MLAHGDALRRGHGMGFTLWVFSLWTATSFLCHFTAKRFLTEVNSPSDEGQGQGQGQGQSKVEELGRGLYHALILTALQMIFCSTLVQLDNSSPHWYRLVARVSHALASLATNVSMAVMFASSTFAIKMMEPITSAIVQFIVLGRPLTPLSIVSLPIIVGGAVVFTHDPHAMSIISIGTLMALTSNVILAFRNIAIKQMSSVDTTSMTFRLSHRQIVTPLCFLVMILCFIFHLETNHYLPPKSTTITLTAVLSAIFHVAYSYVSTGIVLNHMSVVSHAVSNIFKRVLVVLLLYSFGQRHASGFNFLGLLSCSVGLLIYTYDRTKKDVPSKQTTPFLNSKAILWTVLASIIIAISTISYIPRTLLVMPRILASTPDVVSGSAINGHPSSFRSTFGNDGFTRPSDEELVRVNKTTLPNETANSLPTFFQQRLIQTPTDANFLSKELNYVDDIIRETQRLHFNIFEDALKGFKYAMLFDIASFENKGDPCITVGEIYLLKRMNIKVVYYCNSHACVDNNINKAKEIADKYTPGELVILVHGGGNIIGYAFNDILRFKLFAKFPTYKKLVFPQSIWMRQRNHPHVNRTAVNYCCDPNLTIVLRDRLSYDIARELYKGSTRLLMAPDMAFQIGRVPRFMSPVFDILWLKRKDGETPGYAELKAVPKHLRVHISDWWKWLTPAAGSSLEKAFYISVNGFFFLQRGRVVITDRLHGHILSTLMNIPHVLIDNKAKKLSSYHNTWTKSLSNTVITDDPSKALDLAIGLLEKYNHTLPPIVPYLEVNEYFNLPKLGVPIIGYP